MRVYTRQNMADLAPGRYASVYASGRYGESHVATSKKLSALQKPINPDEIDRIVGNDSWTRVRCDECGEYRDGYIAIGRGEDNVSLCFECARTIQSLLPIEVKR